MNRLTTESSAVWSANEIEARLGVSTICFPGDERFGARRIGQIRAAGLTRLEVCGLHPPSHYDYHDRAQVREITSECKKQGIEIVAVHGPGVPYQSDDEDERRAAVEEVVAAAQVAIEMGASVFVAHFGISDQSAKTVIETLDRLPGSDLKLTVENGGDLREFSAFVDRIGSDRFGMVVDIGHPEDEDGVNPFLKQGVARETMALCKHRLFHVHLHDVTDGDHRPAFDGNIQWDDLFAAFRDIAYTGEFMFESAYPDDEVVLAKTAAFPQAFVQRYGPLDRARRPGP